MKKNSYLSKVASIASDMGAWLLIIVVGLILTVATDTFLSWTNIMNVIRQTAVVSIIAMGVSFVVLGGEIDLSTGMASTLAGCNTAIFIVKMGMNPVLAILISILIGMAFGLFAGYIVTILKIPAFIGTMGVQYIIQGTILVTTNSMPITGFPEGFLFLGRGYILNGWVPFPVIIMAVFFIVGAFALRYTVFGRSVIAVGENEDAAKLSGLNVKRTKILMFVICGFCSACGGILQASRMSSGQPGSGTDISMQALAAVYIGGTFKGSMLNTLAGALAWGFVNNGLNLLGVNAYWQKIALGIVIIIAVLFDIFRMKLSTAKK